MCPLNDSIDQAPIGGPSRSPRRKLYVDLQQQKRGGEGGRAGAPLFSCRASEILNSDKALLHWVWRSSKYFVVDSLDVLGSQDVLHLRSQDFLGSQDLLDSQDLLGSQDLLLSQDLLGSFALLDSQDLLGSQDLLLSQDLLGF